MFQSKTNIAIIGFALGFWIRLSFVRYSLCNKDLLDTHLDLLDTDITSKNFVCLGDVLKTRRLQDQQMFAGSVYDHSTSLQKQPPRGVLEKKVFRKYAANLQENTLAEVRFQ